MEHLSNGVVRRGGETGRGGRDDDGDDDNDDNHDNNRDSDQGSCHQAAGILRLPTPQTPLSVGSSETFWSTVAGLAGNVLEWYDFAVFGFFGDIIGQVFFPPDQKGNRAIMESFAVFGGAFLMRPVGGVLLGYIGDIYGPKKALVISIFLMACPTFAMGCLPSYQQVGVLSVILLLIVRLLQGLSVGGQLMSSLVYTCEIHPSDQWGYYGSFVLAAANLGTLLGAVVGAILRSSLREEDLVSWGWRVPFWSGIIVSFSGFYLRNHGGEGHHYHPPDDGKDPTGNAESDTDILPVDMFGAHNPLREAFRRSNLRPLLACTLVPMLWSAGFYLTFVWMAIYMQSLIENAVPHAFVVNCVSLLLSVCFMFPIAGSLSDRYGRPFIMRIGGIGICLLSPLLFVLIGQGTAWIAFCCQMVLGICLSLWGAPMCAWLVESFEENARLTSVAIGYNMAQALAGGSAPFVATLLYDSVGSYGPGAVLTLLAVVSLIGLVVISPANSPTSSSFTTVSGDVGKVAPTLNYELQPAKKPKVWETSDALADSDNLI